MIELSDDDLKAHEAASELVIKMNCMICMAFPQAIIQKDNTRIWKQLPNPVPSNRVCLHLKHRLECPHCKFGVEPEEAVRERYFMEPKYREEIIRRDNHACQACGYKLTEKPQNIPNRMKNESEEEYLYRRFTSDLARSDKPKSLVVAHYSRRYDEETYENRHKMQNARTLCVDCHNLETAKHQMEA